MKRVISTSRKQVVATGRKLLGPSREYETRIERYQSPWKMLLVPILSVMAGSMITALPVFSDGPMLPPLGYMIMLGWRLMRPGIWPAWVGLPFGLFDDLFSGQPFGSAALLWSFTMLAIEIIDARAAWRDHVQDWLIATVAIMLVLAGGLAISGLAHRAPEIRTIVPQIIVSILAFPLVVRLCARLDRWRLTPT
jgi:rod shape-determining protein MreD